MPAHVQHDRLPSLDDGEELDDPRGLLKLTTVVLGAVVALPLIPVLLVEAGARSELSLGMAYFAWFVELLAIPAAILLALAWLTAGTGSPGTVAPRRGRSVTAVALASAALMLLVLEILLVGGLAALILLA